MTDYDLLFEAAITTPFNDQPKLVLADEMDSLGMCGDAMRYAAINDIRPYNNDGLWKFDYWPLTGYGPNLFGTKRQAWHTWIWMYRLNRIDRPFDWSFDLQVSLREESCPGDAIVGEDPEGDQKQ